MRLSAFTYRIKGLRIGGIAKANHGSEEPGVVGGRETLGSVIIRASRPKGIYY